MNFCHSKIIIKSYLNLMMCIEIITRLVSLYSFLNVLWNSSGTQVNRLLLMMFIILHSLYMCIYTSFIYFYRYIFKIYTFAYIFLDASHRIHSLLAITHRKHNHIKPKLIPYHFYPDLLVYFLLSFQ